MAEMPILRRILMACSRGTVRLFRNNVAGAWVGKVQRIERVTTLSLFPGDVVLRKARPLRAGLCEGSSDLIGLRSVVVTQEMVGQTFALFVACEVKDKAKLEPEQARFLEMVRMFGGVAIVAHSVEEAEAALYARQ